MAFALLTVLLAMLSGAMLLAWHPWGDNELVPELTIAPGMGVGLGDAKAVASASPSAIAGARGVSAGRAEVGPQAASASPAPVPALAVSVARPVSRVVAASPDRPPATAPPAPSPSPSPAPVATPAPQLAATPAPQPVSTVEKAPATPPERSTAGVVVPVRVENAVVQICDGHEYVLDFSAYLEEVALAPSDGETSIVRVVGGESLIGEDFLEALSEREWHEIEVRLAAASAPQGFYAIYLDGEPVQLAVGVGLVPSEGACALLEIGLSRDGQAVQESSELRIAGLQFSDAQEPPLP